MGIPSYFSHIIRKYKKTILRPSVELTVNNLYLDCNSIIYDAVQRYYTEYPTGSDESDSIIIQYVCDKIEEYIKCIHPTNTVIIAFDGVAPVAKLSQQRTRRIKTKYQSTINEKISNVTNTCKWDTAKITPSTLFMEQLTVAVQCKFAKYIVTSSDEIGEGEHKIFDYIRKHPEKKNETTVVYGLDADLIMLSLLHVENAAILLFRETPYFISQIDDQLEPNKMYCVDINELAKTICAQLTTKKTIDIQRLRDYVFMCFLLGNDFLPHFPAINIRTDGISVLLTTYMNTIYPQYLTNQPADDICICWPNVTKFITHLAKGERNAIIKRTASRTHYKLHDANLSQTEKRLQQFDRLPCIDYSDETFIRPKMDGWTDRYYWALMNTHPTHTQKEEMSLSYLKGLEWTYLYYTIGCVDWRWTYDHHYPPLLADLATYMNTNAMRDVRFLSRAQLTSTAIHPHCQLCYVLPPESYHLLPPHVYQSVAHLLPNPSTFHVTIHQFSWAYCSYFWESHITLPPISINMIEKIVQLQL